MNQQIAITDVSPTLGITFDELEHVVCFSSAVLDLYVPCPAFALKHGHMPRLFIVRTRTRTAEYFSFMTGVDIFADHVWTGPITYFAGGVCYEFGSASHVDWPTALEHIEAALRPGAFAEWELSQEEDLSDNRFE